MTVLNHNCLPWVMRIQTTLLHVLLSCMVFSFYTATAQRSDFIVKKTGDTVYVEKVILKYDCIKVKNFNEKTKYTFDEIQSFYVSDKKCHYEKIKFTYKKTSAEKRSDFFFIRLTNGKVKLYQNNGVSYGATFNIAAGMQFGAGLSPISATKNITFYIAILDAVPELLSEDAPLQLTNEVYEILKEYLYGNPEIEKKLEQHSNEKPLAKKEKIINLINEYNTWVKSK